MDDVKQTTIDTLKAALQTALTSGDVEAITKASQAVVNFQREAAKAQAELARKEAEAMSGQRTELASKLTETLKASPLGKANFTITLEQIELATALVKLIPHIVKEVKAVKGTVVSFKLADEQSDTPRVALAVLASKKSSSGGGNGKRGKLQEVFEQFATDDEKQALAKAIEDARAKTPDCRVDGIEYQHRSKVYKAAIASGKITPA